MAILPIDSGRYGTREMLAVFGEQRRIDCQVRVEGAAAAAQGELGIIPRAAAREIARVARAGRITARRVAALERTTAHDTAALVQAISEKCAAHARPWVHYGLTSNDLVDTATSMQMRDALAIVQPRAARLALALARRARQYRRLPAVGRTHGQHASIIPFGLKFANWAAEVAGHVERLEAAGPRVLLCKTLGVVGTGSLMGAQAVRVQARVAERLGLSPVAAATQVIPRERHAEYVFCLSLLGATLEKVAVEVRNLQRTEIGEVSEGFRRGQMGSSAVPVKRNPTKSERVTSLARLLRSGVGVTLENVALWHERDLSNSANERFVLPTTAILADEMVVAMTGVIDGLAVDTARVAKNLEATRGQVYAEFVLDALIKKGVPRMEAYRDVQRVAFAASAAGTDFAAAVTSDAAISSRLSAAEVAAIFTPERRLGAAPAIIDSVCRSVARVAARH